MTQSALLFSVVPVLCNLSASIGGAFLLRAIVRGELFSGLGLAAASIRYKNRLKRDLSFLRSSWSPDQIVFAQLVVVFVGLLISLWSKIVGGVVLLFALAPLVALARGRARRALAIERQVEAMMGALARALEAAPSLGEALHATIGASAAPMSEELELVVSEMELGRSLERALLAWERRVGNQVLSLALSTLQIGRQTGGSLPQVLKEAAASLREMERLQGVVRTKTAEGRAQSMLIGGLPFLIYVGMNFVDPTHLDPLSDSSTGHLLVGIAVLLWIFALFAMKKILTVRI